VLVAVFSKSYCPYCKATKQLLSEMGAKPYIIELDEVGTYPHSLYLTMSHLRREWKTDVSVGADDGSAIQDALYDMTNQRSVPNIFIDKNHIGGNSDLQAKKSQLPELLKAAHAI
jgi:glutaredoxin 3